MTDTNATTLSVKEVARLRKLLDRQDLEDCLSRVARGTDRFDREMFLSAFHPGATVSTVFGVVPAEDTYANGQGFHAQATHATLHCLSTSACDIDGDDAHTETYHIYAARNQDGAHWAAAGRYLDRFERREGKWGIVFRRIVVEWTGVMQPHELAFLENVAAPKDRLGASRDRDDVSYVRPLA